MSAARNAQVGQSIGDLMALYKRTQGEGGKALKASGGGGGALTQREERELYESAEAVCLTLNGGVSYRRLYQRNQRALELLLDMLRADAALAESEVEVHPRGTLAATAGTLRGLLDEAQKLLRDNGVEVPPSLSEGAERAAGAPNLELGLHSPSFAGAFVDVKLADNNVTNSGEVRRSSILLSPNGSAISAPAPAGEPRPPHGGSPRSGQFEPLASDGVQHPQPPDPNLFSLREDAAAALPPRPTSSSTSAAVAPHPPVTIRRVHHNSGGSTTPPPRPATASHAEAPSTPLPPAELPEAQPPTLSVEEVHLLRRQQLRELYGRWYAARGDAAAGASGGEVMLRDLLGVIYTHEYDTAPPEPPAATVVNGRASSSSRGRSPAATATATADDDDSGAEDEGSPSAGAPGSDREAFARCRDRLGQLWTRLFRSADHLKAGAGVDEVPVRTAYVSACLESGQKPSPAVLAALQHVQQERQLETLALPGARLGDAGVATLARVLPRLYRLRALDLTDNDLGDAGLCALADALRWHPTLATLTLAHNHLTAECADELATLVRTLPRLASVSLEGCPVSSLRPTADAAVTREALAESRRLMRQHRQMLEQINTAGALLQRPQSSREPSAAGAPVPPASSRRLGSAGRASPPPQRLSFGETPNRPGQPQSYAGAGDSPVPLPADRAASARPATGGLYTAVPMARAGSSSGVAAAHSSSGRPATTSGPRARAHPTAAGERQVAAYLRRQVGVNGGLTLPHIAAARQHLDFRQ